MREDALGIGIIKAKKLQKYNNLGCLITDAGHWNGKMHRIRQMTPEN